MQGQSIEEPSFSHPYTLVELKLAREDLLQIKLELDIRPEESAKKVFQYCQIIIWADRHHNSDFFDYFCETKSSELLFQLFARAKHRQVLVSIVSNITKLISNLSKETLQVLMTHPALTSFQMVKFNNVTTELAQYYVNFLKVLSQKLDQQFIHYVFNQRCPMFPLAWQAIRFYNHPETLIRTTCRNIVLSILKIDEPHVQNYVQSFPFVMFYSHIGSFIRQHWIYVNNFMENRDVLDSQGKKARLLENIEDHYDLLLFVEDVIKLSKNRVAACMINGLLAECMSLLYKSIVSNMKQALCLNFIVYIIGVLLKNTQQPALADTIIFIFFGRYSRRDIIERLIKVRQPLASYNKIWSFKHFWDSHDEDLQKYMKQVYLKIDKRRKAIDLLSDQPMPTASMITTIFETTLSMIGINRPKFEHELQKIMSIYSLDSPSNSLYDDIIQVKIELDRKDSLDLNLYEQNQAKMILLSFLASKDDALVNLTLQMLLNLFRNKGVSQSILTFTGLNARQKSTDFQTRTTFEKIIKLCIQILKVDSVNFRLCTVKNAIEVIVTICKPYLDKIDQIIGPQLKVDMFICLKLAVEKTKINFQSHKSLVSLVHLFDKCESEYQKLRAKSLAYFGLFVKTSEDDGDLYEKQPIATRDIIQCDFHRFFQIKRLLEEIRVKPKQSIRLQYAPQDHIKMAQKYVEGKEVEMGSSPHFKADYRDNHSQQTKKYLIVPLQSHFLLLEQHKDKPSRAIVKSVEFYYNIYRMTIQQANHNLLHFKMRQDSRDFELEFENYKGSTATKIKIEECRYEVAKYVFKQINLALNNSIQML